MKPAQKRSGVKKKRKLGPVKRLVNRISKAAADRKATVAARKAEANRQLKAAVEQGLRAVTPEEIAAINANPKLARAINEEAAVRAAAEYGVNIRKENGRIDMKLARQAAETAAIQAAAEMGFNITDSRGKISRRKALEAARAADEARAGKPVNAQVAAVVSRQDARLAAEIKAAERRGFSIEQLGEEVSRRDAFSDAELAALLRRNLHDQFG